MKNSLNHFLMIMTCLSTFLIACDDEGSSGGDTAGEAAAGEAAAGEAVAGETTAGETMGGDTCEEACEAILGCNLEGGPEDAETCVMGCLSLIHI